MAAIKENIESLETLLKNFNEEEKNTIVDAMLNALKEIVKKPDSLPVNPLAKEITGGRTWSQAEKAELEIKTLASYFVKRRELLENTITVNQVAELLGTSRQTPHDRMKSQTLLGILDKGAYRFPIWQFDPEGPDGVIDGLPQVLKALEIPDFSKLNWLMRPNPYLDGLTPIAALKIGEKERVIEEAAAVGIR